jgi:F-type H+-transporting ATPase subunit b
MKGFKAHGPGWARRVFILAICVTMLAMVGSAAVFASDVEGEHGNSEHAAPHGKGWVKTDWYRVMNFAVLAIALFLVLRKPAAQALNNRIKGISAELQDLESRKKVVENQLAQYNAKLSSLDKEAEQIVNEYIRQGEEAKVRILKEAQASAEKLKEQAKKNIDYEFEQAKLSLQKTITEKALAKAEQVIKQKITAEDQNRLVDEYLNKVVA